MSAAAIRRAGLISTATLLGVLVVAGCGTASQPGTHASGGAAETAERNEEAVAVKHEEEAEVAKDRELLAQLESKKREEVAEAKAKKTEKSAAAKAKKKLDQTAKEAKKHEEAVEAKLKAAEKALREARELARTPREKEQAAQRK